MLIGLAAQFILNVHPKLYLFRESFFLVTDQLNLYQMFMLNYICSQNQFSFFQLCLLADQFMLNAHSKLFLFRESNLSIRNDIILMLENEACFNFINKLKC